MITMFITESNFVNFLFIFKNITVNWFQWFVFFIWSSWTSCVVHSPQMRKSHLCPTRSVSPTASYGKTNFSSVKKLFSYQWLWFSPLFFLTVNTLFISLLPNFYFYPQFHLVNFYLIFVCDWFFCSSPVADVSRRF